MVTVRNAEEFLRESRANGWKFYAAVPPEERVNKHASLADMAISPLASDPCVLILGAESEGLPRWMLRFVDHRIAIGGRAASAEKAGVDSLNVSVAGAMLIERFLRKTEVEERAVKKSDEERVF